MSEKIAITKLYDDDYQSALKKAFMHINFDVNDLRNKSVVIKPNLCNLNSAETGSTTDVHLVEALVKLIQDSGCKRLVIAESDHFVSTAEEEFSRMGYKEMAEKYGISLMNISKASFYTISFSGKHFDKINVPQEMLNYDFFISVPKLKMHPECYLTCALKNLYGMNPERYKAKHHPYLSQALYDLNKLYKTDLVVVDANFVQTSQYGAKKVGLIMTARNPLAVDVIAAKLFGIRPQEVPYLKYVSKHWAPMQLEVLGEKIDDYLIEKNFKFHYGLLFRLGYAIYRTCDKLGYIGEAIKRRSKLILRAGAFMAGRKPSELIPAIIEGYHKWREK